MAIKDLVSTKKCLFICNGGSCMRKDAEKVTQEIRQSITDYQIDDSYHTVRTKCMGRCDDAPIAMLVPDNIWLKKLDHNKCDLLISQIESDQVIDSPNFLHKMGTLAVNSKSIPTKYREKPKQ